MQLKIGIIGGGLGGLCAALALLDKGYDVEVYEQAKELGEVGAGVQLTPNGSRALISLGLESALLKAGTETTGKKIYQWNTGETHEFMRLGRESQYDTPYLTFHRADLLGLLKDALDQRHPGAVRLGKRFSRQTQTPRGVEVEFEDGTSTQVDLVVGADGIHSRVRKGLFGEDKVRFTGCMAWRGLIPAAYAQSVADMRGGSMWLGPHAHIVTYPVRQGELLNFIAMVDRSDWTQESWNIKGTNAECLSDFEGWHKDVHRLIENIDTPFKWALIVREPLAEWSSGRVTLLGDACHSTLPFLSQGANMAFEDGVVLARCLAAFPNEPEHALKVYENTRKERTKGIIELSEEQLERTHSSKLADPGQGAEYIDREYDAERVNERYRWIYGYDATTVELAH